MCKTKTICLPAAYLSTFLLTLANPVTIISYSLIGANFGLGVTGRNRVSSILVIIGVFIGSVLWWSVLSGGVNILKKNLTNQGVQNITKVAGIIAITLGLSFLIGGIK